MWSEEDSFTFVNLEAPPVDIPDFTPFFIWSKRAFYITLILVSIPVEHLQILGILLPFFIWFSWFIYGSFKSLKLKFYMEKNYSEFYYWLTHKDIFGLTFRTNIKGLSFPRSVRKCSDPNLQLYKEFIALNYRRTFSIFLFIPVAVFILIGVNQVSVYFFS